VLPLGELDEAAHGIPGIEIGVDVDAVRERLGRDGTVQLAIAVHIGIGTA